MWLKSGRHSRVRHAHLPVGDYLHVNAHQSETDSRICTSLHAGAAYVSDAVACRCGYILCSQTGPCAPKPADVLPEGWTYDASYPRYMHESRAIVRDTGFGWAWFAPGVQTCNDSDLKDTRDLAMTAALEAAKPAEPGPQGVNYKFPVSAEPELRPGWSLAAPYKGKPTEEFNQDGFYAVVFESEYRPGQWITSACEDYSFYFPTREAALLETERLFASWRSR